MALIEIDQLPNMDLFGIFTAHFVLMTWASLGDSYGGWSPNTYMFYNGFLLIALLWCLKDSSNDLPVVLAIRINIISIVFDLLLMMWYFPLRFWANFGSIIGAFIHLVFRFASIPLLSKICCDRNGGINDGIPYGLGNIFGGNDGIMSVHDPYEDIDNSRPHQSYPSPSDPIVVTSGGRSQSFAPKTPPPSYQT